MVFLSLYILDEKRSSERKYNDSFIEIFPEVTLKNAEQFILEMEHQKSTFCQKSCEVLVYFPLKCLRMKSTRAQKCQHRRNYTNRHGRETSQSYRSFVDKHSRNSSFEG